jgi:hypothetical protein
MNPGRPYHLRPRQQVREFPDDSPSLAPYLGLRATQSRKGGPQEYRQDRQVVRRFECMKGEIVMSTATGIENAGRMPLGWTVAIVGTGLMIALIVGLLLQQGSDDVEEPTRHAAGDVTVSEATADYGIRHLQKSDARPLDATADYGIRLLSEPRLRDEVKSVARSGELDGSADYGVRHARPAPSLAPEADYGIRHPQRIVRPFAPADDYGVRNREALER